MKVLVTGAAGFIGSHVVDALRALGADVLALDSLDPEVHRGVPGYLRDDVDYCFADLRWFRPDRRFEEVEVIVHLAALGGVSRAAREPANIVEANCGGTARLLEFARGWPKLRHTILASSFSVYGGNYDYVCARCGARTNGTRSAHELAAGRFEVLCPKCGNEAMIQPVTEDAVPAPLETYGASKYMQELCLRGFARGRVTVLRFSSVYGTRMRLDDSEATIIARMAGWLRSGRRPQLFEDGRQIRDWVYAGDVVQAVIELASGAPAPAIVNVCSGVPTTLLDACHHISAALHVDSEPDVAGGFRPGDMRHCLGNPTRLRLLLGRDPIGLAEGAVLAFGAHSQRFSVPAASGRS
jgi:dTDP-L-rhamnose 4-epimerase